MAKETNDSTPSTPKKDTETKTTKKTTTETPKAGVKKDTKKTTKPKTEKKVVKKVEKSPKPTKKTTKPEKKAVKKTTKKTTKKEKKTETKTTNKVHKEFTNFENYVIEAIHSLSTEDKPYIGLSSICTYIKTYIPDVKEKSCSRFAHNAADKLVTSGYLKNKNKSYAIAKKGRSLVEGEPPKREALRPPTVKGEKRKETEEKTEIYLVPTSKGRVSRKIIRS